MRADDIFGLLLALAEGMQVTRLAEVVHTGSSQNATQNSVGVGPSFLQLMEGNKAGRTAHSHTVASRAGSQLSPGAQHKLLEKRSSDETNRKESKNGTKQSDSDGEEPVVGSQPPASIALPDVARVLPFCSLACAASDVPVNQNASGEDTGIALASSAPGSVLQPFHEATLEVNPEGDGSPSASMQAETYLSTGGSTALVTQSQLAGAKARAVSSRTDRNSKELQVGQTLAKGTTATSQHSVVALPSGPAGVPKDVSDCGVSGHSLNSAAVKQSARGREQVAEDQALNKQPARSYFGVDQDAANWPGAATLVTEASSTQGAAHEQGRKETAADSASGPYMDYMTDDEPSSLAVPVLNAVLTNDFASSTSGTPGDLNQPDLGVKAKTKVGAGNNSSYAAMDGSLSPSSSSPSQTAAIRTVAPGNQGPADTIGKGDVQPQAKTDGAAVREEAMASVADARLMQTLSRSEMQVSVHDQDFGRFTVHATYGREAISAQITIENAQLGSTLSAHVPVIEHRLVQEHGLRASVSVNTGTQRFSEQGQGSGSAPDRRSPSQNRGMAARSEASQSSATTLGVTTPTAVLGVGMSDRLDVHI